MQGKIKIIVCVHKKYPMPEDGMYLSVQAGAAIHDRLEYQSDAEGDNISAKNPCYCELTALYWAWKNLDCDYLGLAHYRRHFRGKKKRGQKGKFGRIMSAEEALALLSKSDILLPKKRHYYIETNESQYVHAHHKVGLDITAEVLQELYPDCYAFWKKSMSKRSGHRFNMFVMKKSLSDEYCSWLFSILSEVEKRLDISGWSVSEQRVYGYLAERLLDVWVDYKGLNVKDVPYMFMEKQNWFKKGWNFLKRKINAKNSHGYEE